MDNQETKPTVEETEEKTETQEASPAAVEESEPQMRSDEVIDVEWPEVEQVFKINQYSKSLEAQLADMCVRFEKGKQNFLSRISECETFLYNSGATLRESMAIDPELTYELKLPSQEGEKAFFLRKDV